LPGGHRAPSWPRVIHLYQEIDMNKEQVKGTLKDAAGKVQQKTGELINSPDQQAKGLAKQVEGKTEKAVGNLKEAVDDATKRNRP
jgi:uncharacterized protein YjbJ (UPF0337 family)